MKIPMNEDILRVIDLIHTQRKAFAILVQDT